MCRVKEAQDKVLAECEMRKLEYSALEEELKILQEEANVMKMTSDK